MNLARISKFAVGFVAALVIAGCTMGSTFQKTPSSGRFSGDPKLISIAPNTFIFVQPSKAEQKRGAKPFSFTTHVARDTPPADQAGRGRFKIEELTITPDSMITTGASVPHWMWSYSGLGAWYHPGAGLIHDWLFESHHRYMLAQGELLIALKNKNKSAQKLALQKIATYKKLGALSQDDMADIYAEAMRVLMKRNDDLLGVVDPTPAKSDRQLSLLANEVKRGRSRPFILWGHHWAVSSDGAFGLSRRIYDPDEHKTDHEAFEAVGKMVSSNPGKFGQFVSEETAKRINEILADENKQYANQSVHQEALKEFLADNTAAQKLKEKKLAALRKVLEDKDKLAAKEQTSKQTAKLQELEENEKALNSEIKAQDVILDLGKTFDSLLKIDVRLTTP